MSVHAIIWPHTVADCGLRVVVIDRGPACGVTVPPARADARLHTNEHHRDLNHHTTPGGFLVAFVVVYYIVKIIWGCMVLQTVRVGS
jgi:hypothetical protein